MRNLFVLLGLAALMTLAPVSVRAQDYTVTIKDHRFTPEEIKVPANKRVTITVINDDPTPEEFESKPMKVEKVIPGKSKGVVRIGPLKPGRYPFVGEFHGATARRGDQMHAPAPSSCFSRSHRSRPDRRIVWRQRAGCRPRPLGQHRHCRRARRMRRRYFCRRISRAFERGQELFNASVLAIAVIC
jgi:hypothetical protein